MIGKPPHENPRSLALACLRGPAKAASPLHFTGKPRDPETGLDNFGARSNSGTLGRFLTPDWSDAPTPVPYASLASPQTLDLYAYSGNNPVSVVDRDGHLECYLDGAATPCGDAFNDVSTGSAGICPGTCSTFFNGQYYQYFFGAGTAAGWEKFGDIAAGLTEWDGQLFTNDEMQQIEADREVDQQVALAEYLWDHYRKLLIGKKLTTLAGVYDQLSFAKTVGGNTEFNVGTKLAGALTGLGLEIANGGSGCLMCRTGDRPSPHFDHGLLHLDNYRGGYGVYDSVMHVLVDVIVGQSLYGEVPFLRNSPGS